MGFPDLDPLAAPVTEEEATQPSSDDAVTAEADGSGPDADAEAEDVAEAVAQAGVEVVVTETVSEETMLEILDVAIDADQSFNGQSSPDAFSAEELMPDEPAAATANEVADASLKAVLEAIIYVTDEPLTLDQIAVAIEQPRERVAALLEQLAYDYEDPSRGLSIKEVAGGYKMATKPEHHEAVRRFVRNLNPPLKLSLPALETLAVIAYKQPITAPEIMEIRGVQGASVLKTLLDRKLIAAAGRKHVIGKPILYKTTREFLVQFGLKDVSELPTLKEFQEIGRFDTEMPMETAAQMPAELPLLPEDAAGSPEEAEDISVMPEPAAEAESGVEPAAPEAITPEPASPEAAVPEATTPETTTDDALASTKTE